MPWPNRPSVVKIRTRNVKNFQYIVSAISSIEEIEKKATCTHSTTPCLDGNEKHSDLPGECGIKPWTKRFWPAFDENQSKPSVCLASTIATETDLSVSNCFETSLSNRSSPAPNDAGMAKMIPRT